MSTNGLQVFMEVAGIQIGERQHEYILLPLHARLEMVSHECAWHRWWGKRQLFQVAKSALFSGSCPIVNTTTKGDQWTRGTSTDSLLPGSVLDATRVACIVTD